MNATFAGVSIGLGLAYLGLAVIAVIEVAQARRTRGVSRFGLAYVGMAMSCGPHHILHGTEAIQGFNANWPMVASVLVGLPAGVIFVGLRIKAKAGGRGDRHVRATPGLLMLGAVAFCYTAGVLVTVAACDFGGGHHPS